MNDRAYHLAYRAMGESNQEFNVPRAWFEMYTIQVVRECIRALEDSSNDQSVEQLLNAHFGIE